ncbi:conjugative transfer relaxase/helicase TraI [Legionella sp. 16cNR16C]|uniref:conjugative transfer relaxase/helicase TraI n=1 Tax=Legionella sp. 16cNR16C TaxID=2905656 RepID=UPI001E3A7DBA|nr:conjugative transfer relaxase/helicase TraI [Legionella sp. 16cNR16C]MCE3043700.1 conjugative transfer relaxase/helicase TraI [Legionella sp. 16cNR16C]
MLTLKKIGGANDALHYYTNQDNYYLSDRDALNSMSRWLGNGAKQLNLSGVIEPEQFLKLLSGELPSGQLLGIIENGERKHRPGTDVTLSAPKSVSILALVGKDERLLKAHEEAVGIAFERIEQLAAEARITFNKETTFEKTRNLVAASFIHTTSRELDPDLHTHLAILNMTERSDGLWRALSSRAKQDKDNLDHGFRELIYSNQHYLGLVYMSSLAKKVRELGYSIHIKDRYGNFEIEGISEEAIKVTSKRREQIVQDMKERGTTSAKAAEKSNLSTRKKKVEVDSESLHQLWKEEIAGLGLNLEEIVQQSKYNKGKGEVRKTHTQPLSSNPQKAVSDALLHLSEYSTQIQHGTLVRQAMSFSAGLISHEEIEQEIESLLAKEALKGKPLEYYTTKGLLRLEKEFISSGTQDLKTGSSLHIAGYGLASDIFKSPDRIQIIDVNGFHSEKELIQDMVNLASEQQLNPYVLHPGRLKTLQLREEIKHSQNGLISRIKNFFKDDIVHTVSGFQYHYGKRIKSTPWTKNKQDMVIVHDAQKLSLKDLSALSELTKENKSKLILLNNSASTLGFSAGNPIKLLKDNGVHSHQSFSNPIKGELKLAVEKQHFESMMSAWLRLTPEEQQKHTLVAINNKQKEAINSHIREGLMNKGQLSRQTTTVSVLSTVSLTPPQRERADCYQIGDRISFYKEGRAATHYIVRGKNKNSLVLENLLGKQSEFSLNSKEEYRISREKRLDITVGERLINDRTLYVQRRKVEPKSAFTVSKITESGLYVQQGSESLFLNHQMLSDNYFSYDYCKNPQEIAPNTLQAFVCAEPYQLNRNLMGEIGENAKNVTLFTRDEVKAQKFLQKAQQKWTAFEVQQKKPDLIYREIAYANPVIEKELKALINNLELKSQDKAHIAQAAIHYAIAKCAERNAAFKHSDLMTHALKYALGEADFEDIAPILKQRMSNDLVYLETYWTTKDALELEDAILHANFSEQNQVTPIAPHKSRLLSLPDSLTQGQKDAITLITTTADRFVSIQGLAGVGKTTMMRHVREIATENEFKVLGLAPTHKAVEELNANGIPSQTIDSFLQNETPIDSRYVLIVDESSMIDNEKYHALQKKCIETNSRMAFTGDITQLQSLASGIPHELTIKSQSQKTAYMEEIVRQNPNPELKKAAELSSKREVGQALDVIKNINPEAFVERQSHSNQPTSSIIEIDCNHDGKKNYKPIYKAISEDFLSRTGECQKNTLIVVHAHEDRTPIEMLIRDGLKKQDQIVGNDTQCGRLFSKTIDQADQVFAKSFEPGDVIRFGKSYSVAKKDGYFTVQKVDTERNKLICTDEANTSYSINASILPKTMPSFYKYDQYPLASGDRIRLKRNDTDKGIIANEEYAVTRLHGQTAILHHGEKEIVLDLTQKSDQHWDYAYTNTAYSSQGATRKLVIALELEDRIVVTTHRSHEIDLTRASHQTTIYTDHLNGLIERLEDPLKQRDADKTSAVLTAEHYRLKYSKQQLILSNVINKKNEVALKKDVVLLNTDARLKNDGKLNPVIRAEEVYEALIEVAEPLVKSLLGEPNHQLSTKNCYRYGTKGSLKIDTNTGLWHNFETEESGNLFHLIEQEQGLSGFKDALDYAARFINYMPDYERKAPKAKVESKDKLKNEGKRNLAQSLFQKSLPIKGSLAEKYLLVHRGLDQYNQADLRYCPSVYTRTQNGDKYVPALLAFSKDEQGGIHHVQVTKLDKSTGGKDKSCEPVKQTFGSITNHVVNLNNNGKGDTAYLTEGVETGLSILHVNEKAPVYAVLGKANFANIDTKNLPDKVILCVDNDGQATYKYAKNEKTNPIIRAAERLNDAGFKVSIIIPKKENTDLNDILVIEGRDALRKQLSQGISLDEFKQQCEVENIGIDKKTSLVTDRFQALINQDQRLNQKGTGEFLELNKQLINRIKERSYSKEFIENNRANELHNSPLNREMEREL